MVELISPPMMELRKPKLITLETRRDTASYRRLYTIAAQVLKGINQKIFFLELASGAKTANTQNTARPGITISGSSQQNKETGNPLPFLFKRIAVILIGSYNHFQRGAGRSRFFNTIANVRQILSELQSKIG